MGERSALARPRSRGCVASPRSHPRAGSTPGRYTADGVHAGLVEDDRLRLCEAHAGLAGCDESDDARDRVHGLVEIERDLDERPVLRAENSREFPATS